MFYRQQQGVRVPARTAASGQLLIIRKDGDRPILKSTVKTCAVAERAALAVAVAAAAVQNPSFPAQRRVGASYSMSAQLSTHTAKHN